MNCRLAAVASARAATALVAFAAAAGALFAFADVASAHTHLVWAGGTPKFQKQLEHRFGAQANDFFPHVVTIHPGDAVEWQGMSIGFHTVDVPGKGEGDIPFTIATDTKAANLTDHAGNPFWFNGQPNLALNPLLYAPSGGSTYDGTTRAESGLPLDKPVPFTLTFTKPGRYVYFCDVHSDMRGVVVVAPKGSPIPSATHQADTVAAQQARDLEIARELERTRVRKGVSLGAAGAHGVEILRMFPRSLHVRAGATVTFSLPAASGETHTVTFGPGAYLKPLQSSIAGPTPTATAVYPSSRSGPIPVPGTHGNGFANSGLLDRDRDSRPPAKARFRFTAPGRYHYVCLLHPFMTGTIFVSR